MFRHYLEWNKVKEYKMLHFTKHITGFMGIKEYKMQMFEHEHNNPVHMHQGTYIHRFI